MKISYSIVNPSCGTCADGKVTAFVTGGERPYTYRWDDADNNVVSYGSGDSVLIEKAGYYRVTVTDNVGCFAQKDSLKIESTVGIVEAMRDLNLVAYPNPSSGLFIINPGKRLEDAWLQVTDVSGRVLLNTTVAKKITTYNINLSDYPAGAYTIKWTEGEAVFSATVVKQ
jgi:hypothetical protein